MPFTRVVPRARAALPDAEFVDVSGSDDAYWRLLCDLWSCGETFVIVEHDIEVGPDSLRSFERCPREWCGFVYALGQRAYGAALGCTRFRASLVTRLPDVMERSRAPHGMVPGHWTGVDMGLAQILQAEGVRLHPHWPPVRHWNPSKAGPDGLTHSPPSTHPHLRGQIVKYRFTGETEEVFPDFGAQLQPGDEIELAKDPKHPRLERVEPKKDTKKEGD